MPRLIVRLMVFCVLAVAFSGSHAQEYPSRPLQMIMPFPAGGIVDIMGRGFAQAMDAKLGQRVVVVNRPGGTMTIGMNAVLQAPPDGYTFIYTPVTPIAIQIHRQKNLQYTKESFIALCQTFENLFWMAAGPKSPFQDIQSLLVHAKANPGKLRYATSGFIGSPHLAGAEFWLRNGVQLTDIPYAGESVAFPHLLTGEVDLGIITTSGVVTQRLRPLAVFSEERIKTFPNVPTVRELGHPILPSGYGGLFIRADTPAAVVQKLESVCRDAAADTAYRDLSEKQYQQATYLDRAAFTARLDADFKAKASLMPSLKLPD